MAAQCALKIMILSCRYSLEDTCELLQDIGFRDTNLFVRHSVTGSDLLELSEEEMHNHLQLSPLQVTPALPVKLGPDCVLVLAMCDENMHLSAARPAHPHPLPR